MKAARRLLAAVRKLLPNGKGGAHIPGLGHDEPTEPDGKGGSHIPGI